MTFDRDPDRRRLSNVEVASVAAEPQTARLVEDIAVLERLHARFAEDLHRSDRLLMLTRHLEARRLRYCVFGGWVRDTMCGIQSLPLAGPPRDIDLVVDGVEVDELLSCLPSDVRPTIFGGIQSDGSPLGFDIWPLHETFLIRHLNLVPTFNSLLRSTDFTINAALFFPGKSAQASELLDGGMLQALLTRTIEFNSAFLPFPVLQCARLAAYAGKLSLHLGPAVREFMETIVANPTLREQVMSGLRENYPSSISERGTQVLQRLLEGGQ